MVAAGGLVGAEVPFFALAAAKPGKDPKDDEAGDDGDDECHPHRAKQLSRRAEGLRQCVKNPSCHRSYTYLGDVRLFQSADPLRVIHYNATYMPL